MLGYLFAALIGLALGTLGGGGSILTVPVLVYVLDFDPKLAIAMSLPVVGAAALVGVLSHWRARVRANHGDRAEYRGGLHAAQRSPG